MDKIQCLRGSKGKAHVLQATDHLLGFPGGSAGKEFTCNAGDWGSIPGSGSSPVGGHGNPFQYSCLENPMDRGDWVALVHGVAKSWTQLKRLSNACRTIYQLFWSLNVIKIVLQREQRTAFHLTSERQFSFFWVDRGKKT